MQALKSARAFWVLWACVAAFKLLLAAFLPLFGDEAWYWLESRRIDWAYSDLPGMTAWLIAAGVGIAGHGELGVRWPFVALSMAVPCLLRATARRLGALQPDQVGMLALLLPLLGALGLLALPDVPLTFAAALALYAVVRLYERTTLAACAWLAVALVVGATSHYRFALLALAGATGLVLDARGRELLRSPRLWITGLVGLLGWVPLLAWNLQHEAAGIAFQFAERHPWQVHAEGFWLPLSQFVVVSPLLLIGLVASFAMLWRRWRSRDTGPWGWLLACAGLPIAIYLALAFVADRERVSFHWLLQAWMPLLLLAPLAMSTWPRVLRVLAWTLAAIGLVAILGFASVAALPGIRAELADSRLYPDNFAGWREIAQQVRTLPGDANGRAPIADNFMLGAQLAFALQRDDVTVLDHPLNHKHGRAVQLRLWGLEADAASADAARWIVVEDSAVPPSARLERYAALCRAANGMASPDVLSVDHGRKRFLLLDRLRAVAGRCVLPAIAWIDAPSREARVGARFDVHGWAFKDGIGIAAIEVVLDDQVVARAAYGEPRPHVAPYWKISTDPAHPRVGFTARVDAGAFASGTHWLSLRLHGKDGSIEEWPAQRIELVE